MPLLILALFIIAALILMRYRPKARAACDWRRVGQKGSLFEFRCATCKQNAYSQHPTGPETCKKHLRNSL
ncbi:MAG: hypothetical protein Q4G36_02955 [Paracoccus sp. (in: a-proteobacteria)]|nr:hypothetical protein [Paracoccus sp. (in: a-proteobacteria)]